MKVFGVLVLLATLSAGKNTCEATPSDSLHPPCVPLSPLLLFSAAAGVSKYRGIIL